MSVSTVVTISPVPALLASELSASMTATSSPGASPCSKVVKTHLGTVGLVRSIVGDAKRTRIVVAGVPESGWFEEP